MSIYSTLKDRLDESKFEGRRGMSGSREAALCLAEDKGGDPALGLKYQCDFRSEEETGTGQMTESFTRTAAKESFIASEYLLSENNKGLSEYRQSDLVFSNEAVVVFASRIYSQAVDSTNQLESALEFIRNQERYSSGLATIQRNFWRMTVSELKAKAKEAGLKGYSKMKRSELEDALAKKIQENDGIVPEESYSQPAWFHYGDFLIIERKAGTVFAEVLDHLVAAAKEGYLVVGGGGFGFGSGFSFFDSRDFSKAFTDEVHASNIWHREQMELLKPVAEIVKKKHGYYALGRPSMHSGEVKYWLNGHSVRAATGRGCQPFGWYTLRELKDEKYMEDMEVNAQKRFEQFDDNGNYRSKKAA